MNEKQAKIIIAKSELDRWLEENRGQFIANLGEKLPSGFRFALYRVSGALAVIMTNETGFDIFTALDSNSIMMTLADAEERLGIKKV